MVWILQVLFDARLRARSLIPISKKASSASPPVRVTCSKWNPLKIFRKTAKDDTRATFRVVDRRRSI
jgi:hypothetical protein